MLTLWKMKSIAYCIVLFLPNAAPATIFPKSVMLTFWNMKSIVYCEAIVFSSTAPATFPSKSVLSKYCSCHSAIGAEFLVAYLLLRRRRQKNFTAETRPPKYCSWLRIQHPYSKCRLSQDAQFAHHLPVLNMSHSDKPPILMKGFLQASLLASSDGQNLRKHGITHALLCLLVFRCWFDKSFLNSVPAYSKKLYYWQEKQSHVVRRLHLFVHFFWHA